jgi:glycerol-3-phosphate O-acyltransferase/dihydroxyacetone phosphate acyltransferase
MDFVVKNVISDEVLKVSPAEDDNEQINFVLESNYKIVPKVDQSAMYESVWSSLRDGRCIGIFPEVLLEIL